jgi:hypothetical protein
VLQSEENQSVWRFQHSTAMVKLKTATIGYFEAISARNRLSIAYFGLKQDLAISLRE